MAELATNMVHAVYGLAEAVKDAEERAAAAREKIERASGLEITLVDLDTDPKKPFRFPMAPEKINVTTGAAFQSYDLLLQGEVKLPAGQMLTGFSWNGILPGKGRIGQPYVKEWVDPRETQSLWSSFRAYKRRLHLTVSGTPIDHDVYLESYNVDYQHGYGDYYYDISFIQAKELKIYTEAEKLQADASTVTGLENTPAEAPRTNPPMPKTYTVKSGDTLWGIAQSLLGDGSRYPEIHSINQPPLGADANLIYPGQVITIPQQG